MSRNFGIPKGVPLEVVHNRARVTHEGSINVVEAAILVMTGAVAILFAEWIVLIGFH